MKKFQLQIVSLILFVFTYVPFVNGQEYKKDFIREVEVKNNDSVVRAHILISGKKIIPNENVIYYWYNENKIYFNQSGIAGFPLHGMYFVFNRAGKLISSGNFQNGLKIGEWKYWYPNGNIKRIEYYKSGRLKNTPSNFDEKGNSITKETPSKFHFFLRRKKVEQDTIQNNIHEKPLQDTTTKPNQQPPKK